MLCGLKDRYRPDIRIRCGLLMMAGSVMVLAGFSFPPLSLLETADVWSAGAVVIGIVAFGIAFHAVYVSENVFAFSYLSHAMLDSEDMASCILGEQGNIIISNSKADDFWGGETSRNPTDILLTRIFDEEISKNAVERLENAVKAGLPEQVEIHLRKNSEGMAISEWYRIGVTPLVDSDLCYQKFLYMDVFDKDMHKIPFLWTAEDITARKNMDEIIKQEHYELSDFLDFVPVGLYSLDSENRFHFVNMKMAEWLGFSKEDLLGSRLKAFLDGDVYPESDAVWKGELKFRTDAGPSFDAFVSHSNYDEAGETMVRAVVVRDVIPENDKEQVFHVAERQFSWLFDEAPVGITFVDTDGTIADCNAAFLRLVGRKRDELVGGPFVVCIDGEDRGEVESQLSKVIMGTVSGANMEVRISSEHRSNSKEAVASMFVSPMWRQMKDGNLDVDGLVLHFIDTTERKSLEEQFAQAQKMQAMGQLAGGVAHDFNNLLTAMIGFSDLLLQRHGPGDPSFADIMQIKQNSNRAANLVRQLLAFSRSQPLRPSMLDVTSAFAELSHLLRRLLGESVDLQFNHGRDLGLVRVDPSQFDQVIINLAVNARDAMPGGGTLTIRTEKSDFSTMQVKDSEIVPKGECVVIQVKDTGSGIPKDVADRIFEPFFTTKERGHGTGLGLSTVYGIIRQTDGFITVDSASGEGTTFTIYLPRYDADEIDSYIEKSLTDKSHKLAKKTVVDIKPEKKTVKETVEKEPVVEKTDKTFSFKPKPEKKVSNQLNLFSPVEEKEVSGFEAEHVEEAKRDLTGQGLVMLVEDEDAVRAFASRALKNKGYAILEASCGEEAIEVIEKNPGIDVLITDMVMPGMDGATLAGLVCAQYPDIKVILISGYSEDVARGDLAASPDFNFLAKPFSLNDLAAKVKEVIDKKKNAD